MKRRIAVITGTRAEYGILRPLIDKIDFHPSLELQLVVTGMHLSPEHGWTVQHIENDGFPIAARVEMQLSGDTTPSMGKSLGIGVTGLTHELERLQPEITIVLGDRIEAFAGSIAGLFNHSVVAHIHGGELTLGAGVDEYMRHAITKLSHLHFAATETAKERILHLGESPDFVFCTGSPALDELVRLPKMEQAEIESYLDFALPDRFVLVCQHPISTQPEMAGTEMEETLGAVKACEIPAIVCYPNADAGSQRMVEVIQRYESQSWVFSYRNLPRPVYINLLRKALVLIGNTSSGIIDTPTLGVPVVNIGERQQGRERGDNVIDVPPRKEEIIQAIQKSLTDRQDIDSTKCTGNPYGDGHASERMVSILETVDCFLAKKAKRLPW